MIVDHVEAQINTDSLFFASMVTPEAIVHASKDLTPVIEEVAKKIAATKSPRLYFVGCGASLSAIHGAKYLLDRFTTIPSQVDSGWQFVNRAPLGVNENAFVFVVSYSGTTPEVVEAKQFALKHSATVISVTNTKETLLAQGAHYVFDYQSKAVYTAPLAILYILCARLMILRGESKEVGEQILSELKDLPAKVNHVIEASRGPARKLAEQYMNEEGFYVLGSGPLFGLAYKLSLSVVIENLWIDACPIDTGEFYHGPLEIVSPDKNTKQRMGVIQLVGTDSTRKVTEQVIKFIAKHDNRQLIFDAKDYPEFSELFTPFALFVATEWFIMYMAALKNHDVDERRYMGKIGAFWGDYGSI